MSKLKLRQKLPHHMKENRCLQLVSSQSFKNGRKNSSKPPECLTQLQIEFYGNFDNVLTDRSNLMMNTSTSYNNGIKQYSNKNYLDLKMTCPDFNQRSKQKNCFLSIHNLQKSLKPVIATKNLSEKESEMGREDNVIYSEREIKFSLNKEDEENFLKREYCSESKSFNQQDVSIKQSQRTDLIIQNNELKSKLEELEKKHKIRSEQYEVVCQRVNNIENELQRLLEDKNELHLFQQQLTSSEKSTKDQSIQTSLEEKSKKCDNQEEKQCQSINYVTMLIHPSKMMREQQLEVKLKNQDIEWRQRFDHIERQYKLKIDQFNRKCLQVEEKERIIRVLMGNQGKSQK